MVNSDPRHRFSSRLSILYGSVRVLVTLHNLPDMAQRRALLLAIHLKIQDILPVSNASAIHHFDGKKLIFAFGNDLRVNTAQALRTKSPEEKLGFNIRIWRLKKGWTQAELARRIGIRRTHLSQIEHGRHHPRPKIIRALAELEFEDYSP